MSKNIIKYSKYLIIIDASNESRTHYLQFTRLVPHRYGPRSLCKCSYLYLHILNILYFIVKIIMNHLKNFS